MSPPIGQQAADFLKAEFAMNCGRGLLFVAFTVQLFRSSGDIWYNMIYVTSDALFAFVVPLVTGSWVDRHGPAQLVSRATAATSAILVMLALTLTIHGPHADIMLLASVLIGVLNSAIRIGVFVLVPTLVHASSLINMNGRHQLASQGGLLLGVLVAGAVMDRVGLVHCLFAIAAGTAVAGWFYARASTGLVATSAKPTYSGNLFRGFARMLGTVMRSPEIIWVIVLGAADLVVVALFNLSLPLLVERHLDGRAMILSTVDVMFTLGSITLGWLVARHNLEIPQLHRVLLLMPIVAIATMLQLIFFEAYAYFLLVYVLGFATASHTVYFTTTVQALVAPELRGRFAAIRRMTSATLVGTCTYTFTAAYAGMGLPSAVTMATLICVALALCCLAWVLLRREAAKNTHADLAREFTKICDPSTSFSTSMESSR
ncbi:MFS transporter [Paraherbaspirillum soli]|uniref:MFS transporter n=1 Tax=Paraherbaspirillum soli TaxID=631222 RepID=A0ABW0MAY1_9BURK